MRLLGRRPGPEDDPAVPVAVSLAGMPYSGLTAFYEGRHYAAPGGQADLERPLWHDLDSETFRHAAPGHPLHNDEHGRRMIELEPERPGETPDHEQIARRTREL